MAGRPGYKEAWPDDYPDKMQDDAYVLHRAYVYSKMPLMIDTNETQ
jgi:hypothetical protein